MPNPSFQRTRRGILVLDHAMKRSATFLIRRLACRLVWAVLFLVSGTALSQERPFPNPISFPGTPWAFAAFVVNSPEATGWWTVSKSPLAADMGKKLKEDHTYGATVVPLKLEKEVSSAEELVEYLRSRRGKESDSNRFEFVEYQEELFPHAQYWCSRHYIKARDRGVRSFRSFPFLIHAITCVHPQERDSAIVVGYSERGGGEQIAAELKDIGEKFIRSLRFLPLPNRPEIDQARKTIRSGNAQEAIQLLQPLAEQNDSLAALLLADVYLHGLGVSTDYQLARKFFEIAAKDGHVVALYNLGVIYAKALGVTRDVSEAIKWFKLAADQRHNTAQFNLAVLYSRGDGVPRDLEEADRWMRMAANNGNETAQRALRGR